MSAAGRDAIAAYAMPMALPATSAMRAVVASVMANISCAPVRERNFPAAQLPYAADPPALVMTETNAPSNTTNNSSDAFSPIFSVISPDTPFSAAAPALELCDMFLVMSVYPGLGGQKFIERTLAKAEEAKNEVVRRGLSCLVEIDGGVTEENAGRIADAGVDVLVAGNTVFRAADMAATIAALRGRK